MQITVSSGRKIYRRASGNLDEARDFFESETMSLPDESTVKEVMLARISLMERLEAAIDVHILLTQSLSLETVQKDAEARKARLAALKVSYK